MATRGTSVLLAVLAAGALLLSQATPSAGGGTMLSKRGRCIQITGEADSRGDTSWTETRGSTRFPDVLALAATHWLIVYNEYTTPFSTADWSRVVLKETRDAGRTWTTRILDEQRKGSEGFLGNWNYVRLGRLSDGRLVLSSCTRYQGNRCYLWFSADEGKTWEGPHDTHISDLKPKHLSQSPGSCIEMSEVVDLGDGKLGVMAHRSLPGKRIRNDLYVSGDGGRTWAYRSTAPGPEFDTCEAALLVRGGRVQIYCRNNRAVPKGMLVIRSEDSGTTWKLAREAGEAPGHQPDVALLRDGRALAIYRVTSTVGVDVWLHDPETLKGHTIGVERVPGSKRIFDCDTGGVAQLSDGTILLTYSSRVRDGGSLWPEKRVRLLVLEPGALDPGD